MSATEQRTDKMGLLFTGVPAVPEMVALAQRAEAVGFESAWIAETRLTRDAFVPAAAIAQATERMRIGTGIVNVYTRNPVVLAITFLSLQELAPGRILMGLGTGSPGVLAPQGVPFDKPLTRLREYCDVIPRLMRGEEVTFDGHAVHLDAARIEDVLSVGDDGLRTEDVPLWLAATGPKAMHYAGSKANGILMNVCLSTDYVRRKLELVGAGAREAGRSLDDIEIAMGILTCPHEDSREGKDAARRFISVYLSVMPNIARETGLDPEFIERVSTTFFADGIETAARLIPDAVVDDIAAAGTPAECHERLDEYRAAGIHTPVVAPVEGLLGRTIELLAPNALTR
ncbi:MAG: class flavin-dependent oxidoreductase [Solirubrobacterales bacterium]|nr:class flavin-dependent oxidoreductase [Solirubrobacterales bacterium]